MAAKKTLEEFLKDCSRVHGNKFCYDEAVYVDSKTKLTIICPKHGRFFQSPNAHLRGAGGCPTCAGNVQLTTEEFIERAKLIHNDRYDYSRVDYKGNKVKVIIGCPIHGYFEQLPESHNSGKGCDRCSGTFKLTTEEFVQRAKQVHGEKYDYSKSTYVNSKTHVSILCRKHGEFKQSPHDHMAGCGCERCGKESMAEHFRMGTEEFVRRAKGVHGDKYNYSNVVYQNKNTEVTIICPEHGEFQQLPSVHLQGCGCQTCAGRPIYTTESFIEKSKQVHGGKYDYSKAKYINGHTKVTIICPEHGEFQQEPNSHMNAGAGCSKCGNLVVAEKSRFTQEEFLARAKEVHSNKYDYSQTVYINSVSEIVIICPTHGEFLQVANGHLQGSGCWKCGGTCPINTEEFVTQAKKVHGDKYDYSQVVYVNASTKVRILCPVHGCFEQQATSHLQGSGCWKCGGTCPLTTEEFVTRAKAVHGDKYDYSRSVYTNSAEKIVVICPAHGEFRPTANNHLHQGSGCPKCHESQGERSIRVYLSDRNIKFRSQWRFKRLGVPKMIFDFAVSHPLKKVLIEFHGEQHYLPIGFGTNKKYGKPKALFDAMRRDHIKLNWCRTNQIPLLVIPFWDKDRISAILDDFFAGRPVTISEPPEIVKKYEPMRKKIVERLATLPQ